MKNEDLSKLLSSLPCPAALLCARVGDVTDLSAVTAMWVSYDPVIVAVYLMPGSLTHKLVNEGRNFTLNVVDEKQNKAALMAGSIPGDSKKLKKLGLKLADSVGIASPRVEGSAASYECRVLKVAACGTHDLFLGLVGEWSVAADGNPIVRFRGESHQIGKAIAGTRVKYPH